MSAHDAPERRRRERRREDDHRFWRALKGERRVADRRRERSAEAVTAPAPAPRPAARSEDGPRGGLEDARGTPRESAPDVGPDDRATGHAGSETGDGPGHGSASPEEARRIALRNMLRAAEARQSRVGRARRPVLARGRRVAIARGELAGHAGTILDADYIDSRVLVRVDGREPPVWVPFSRVAAPE